MTMTSKFAFKVLKHGLRISWVEDGAPRKTTLTLSMWSMLKKAAVLEDHGRLSLRHVYLPGHTRNALVERGLLTSVETRSRANNSYMFTDRNALSPLAVAIVEAGLPDPPPEDEWPKSAPVSPDRVRVSAHQKHVLWALSTGGRISKYVPTPRYVDGFAAGDPDRVVEKRWVPVGRGCHPFTPRTMQPLLKMDLIELGVSVDEVCLVARPTVHGALLAEAPGGEE